MYRKPKPWGSVKPPPGSVLDYGDPINIGLAGFWLLNDAGNIFDITNRAPGTATVITRANGKFGDACSFNGTTSIVNLGTPATLNNIYSNFTISAWVYPRTAGGSLAGRLFEKFVAGAGVSLQYSATVLNVTIGKAAVNATTIASTVLPFNVWTLLTITYTSGTGGARIYQNGIEDAYTTRVDGSGAQGDDSAALASIGNNSAASRTWDGIVDNLRIYKRALSLTEILRLYGEPFAGVVSPRRRISAERDQGLHGGAYRKVQPWGQTKPPAGAQLDFGWRYRNYLVGHYLFSEGAGYPRDSITGILATASGASWGTSPRGGRAIAYTVNTNYINTNRFASFAWKSQGTIAWRCTPNWAFNDGVDHAMWGHLNAGANPVFSAQKYTDNNWYVGFITSGGTEQRLIFAASAANLTQGVVQDYVYTWSAAGQKLYRNGAEIASSVTAPTAQAPTQTMMIGRQNGTIATNNAFMGTIEWWFALNGIAVSQIFAVSLYENPYQMFVPSYMRLPRQSSVTPPVTSGPIFWAARLDGTGSGGPFLGQRVG